MNLLYKYFVVFFFLSGISLQLVQADPFYLEGQLKKTTPETRAVLIAISSVISQKKVGMLTNLRDMGASIDDLKYHMHRYILDKTECKKAKVLTFRQQYLYPSEYVLLDMAVLVDDRIRELKAKNCQL
jgi:hypothetical protein